MKRTAKSLIDFTLGATDGEIGRIKDFYFDDDTWTIRYLVVDTGNWLSGRTVLISPATLSSSGRKNKTLPTNLTKDQIKHSPDINTDIPVTRQEEIKLFKHYQWVSYWASNYEAGVGAFDMKPIASALPIYSSDKTEEAKEEYKDNKHLRSIANVTGYEIEANDGEVGAVEDFIVDDETWKIDYLVIDTGHWFPGRKVIVSPDNIRNIDWESSTVVIDSTISHIKDSPPYDPDAELTTVYTLALHEHYNSNV